MARTRTRRTPDSSDNSNHAVFDLRNERWIPVVRLDGTRDELNLPDVILQAGDLRAISDPLLTVEFGLHRLLVAILFDIFQPEGLSALAALMKKRSFDAAKVRKYFGERYPDRFDLFHPVFPFLQTTGMEAEDTKPLASLLPMIPSGTNAIHFHHATDDAFAVCPAIAARLLTTIAPFMTAGGAGLSPSINGQPPWYVLPRGQSLFDTLCLNLPADPALYPQAVDGKLPAWARPTPIVAERRNQAGLLESLTWQPRRIQFLVGQPGVCALTGIASSILVRQMRFTAGLSVDFSWTDPNVAYKITVAKALVLRPQENKAMWRDTGPLLLLRQADYISEDGKVRFERPAVINQFAAMVTQRRLERSVLQDVAVYGLRIENNMKFLEWYPHSLPLPAHFEWGTTSFAIAQTEIERADSIASALRDAIRTTYPRNGAGNKQAYNSLIVRVHNDFWNGLEQAFRELIQAIGLAIDDRAKQTAVERWRDQVITAAWHALNNGIDDLVSDANSLERVTKAQALFAAAIKKRLYPDAARPARQTRRRTRSSAAPVSDVDAT